MEDSHDRDAEIRERVENDVALEREAQQPFRHFVPFPAEQGLMRQFRQPAVQCVDVGPRLFLAPAFERVISDCIEVGSRLP